MKQNNILLHLLETLNSNLDTSGHRITYSFGEAIMTLKVDNSSFLKFINMYFADFFKVTLHASPQITLYAITNSVVSQKFRKYLFCRECQNYNYATSLNNHIDIVCQNKDKHSIYYFYDKSRRNITILLPCNRVGKLTLMRFARALIKLLLIEHGALPFHAACIVKNGYSICFIGAKLSGKTTTLINALLNCDCGFLSNDEALVNYTNNLIYGLPVSIGIRLSTIRQFSCLQSLLGEIQNLYYTQSWQSKNEFQDYRIYLRPQHLSSIFKCKIRPIARIGCFVVPVLAEEIDEVRLIHLSQKEAANYLMANYLRVPFEEQSYLNNCFCVNTREANRIIDQISNTIPVYKLIQNARNKAKSAILLNELFSRISNKRQAK